MRLTEIIEAIFTSTFVRVAQLAKRLLSGRVAGTTRIGTPLNVQGLLLGILAGEPIGLMVGWGSGPSFMGGRVGFDACSSPASTGAAHPGRGI